MKSRIWTVSGSRAERSCDVTQRARLHFRGLLYRMRSGMATNAQCSPESFIRGFNQTYSSL